MQLKIYRADTVPSAPFVPSAMYIVKPIASAEVDMYFTNSDGTTLASVVTHAKVDQKIATALSQMSSMKVASTITARNALAATFTSDMLVLVSNASADPQVTSGSAMYAYTHATSAWEKIYELEGMDIVYNWANLEDKPTSGVAAIDQAVSLKHAHANASILNGITTDGNGYLSYNGVSNDGGVLLTGSTW